MKINFIDDLYMLIESTQDKNTLPKLLIENLKAECPSVTEIEDYETLINSQKHVVKSQLDDIREKVYNKTVSYLQCSLLTILGVSITNEIYLLKFSIWIAVAINLIIPLYLRIRFRKQLRKLSVVYQYLCYTSIYLVEINPQK